MIGFCPYFRHEYSSGGISAILLLMAGTLIDLLIRNFLLFEQWHLPVVAHLPLPSSPLPVHRRLGARCAFTGSLAAGPPIKWNGGFPSKLATLPSILSDDMNDLADDIVPVRLGLSNFRLIPLLLLLNISACSFCCCCWNGYLCAVAPNWNCIDNGWTSFGAPN